MSLYYEIDLIDKAKELRKNATPQENELWYKFLRKYPVRFQRQKAIGHYMADFYCHKALLVVEIDGFQHYEHGGREYDSRRTKELESYGITVLRYTNRDVDFNFPTVCNHIDATVKKLLAEHGLPQSRL